MALAHRHQVALGAMGEGAGAAGRAFNAIGVDLQALGHAAEAELRAPA